MFFNNIILGMPKIDESLKLKCTFLTAQYGAFCQKKKRFFGNKYVYLKGDLTKNSPRVWEIRDPGKNPGRG